MMKDLRNGYKFVREYELSQLEEFNKHRRMRVFYHKGMQCSMKGCSKVGTRLIVGKDQSGNLHLDIYTDDLELMTIDHYVPKALGGSNRLENLVPMCHSCNRRKGHWMVGTDPRNIQKPSNHQKRANIYFRRWRKYVRKHGVFVPAEISMVRPYTLIKKNKLHKLE